MLIIIHVGCITKYYYYSIGQYSPVIQRGRHLGRNVQSTSRLEVPHKYHPSPLHNNRSQPRSTSSSPSTSTHSSPCNTPISPRSPVYIGGYAAVPVIFMDDSMEDDDEIEDDYRRNCDRLNSEEDYMYTSSRGSSINDISDESRLGVARGLRPPPQVVSAQSLPNLLMVDQSDGGSGMIESSSGDMYTNSENNLQSWIRKESLINTLSTADSRTSTLVESALVSIISEECIG